VDDVIDFLAFSDVWYDLDGEILGVLEHVDDDLLNSYLDGSLELAQVVNRLASLGVAG
jgi:hypothetical protein